MKKQFPGMVLVAFALVGAMPRATDDDTRLIWFKPTRVDGQLFLESEFTRRLSADGPKEWMRRLSARPHHVGSEHGRANAEFLQEQFLAWGYEASIETFDVLFPVPTERSLELLEPMRFTAGLEEPALAEDESTQFIDDALPSYNAYSADGDVTAELIYVNQGIPADYEDLARMGIDVKGKIVIARYGGSWRGIKPKMAAEHGAVGCILYSDPRDDGYFVGEPYPEGAMRSEHGAQRGSVSDIPLMTGDPLTPFTASTAGAERLSLEDSPTLMKIPVLPISYSDALPLLRALGGPVAPERWRGGLPLTYRVGPGPAVVRLKVKFDWSTKPAHNVIARLEGSAHPDEWIMRGNHHDAWVFGARDPISGLVALMEEARVIGAMHKEGWRPRRTIVYAAWDAEEPGLIGSTEWVETHQQELRQKLAVYINTDSNSRGFLSAGGSHALERFIVEVADDVKDPQTGASVAERALAKARVEHPGTDGPDHLSIDPLGSGSDYTPFLQHAGIASLNLSFSGEAEWGAYHSMYDTYRHFEQNSDPGYAYTVTLADVAGRATLRLAEADVLPFHFEALSDKISDYLTEVKELAENMRSETDRMNKLIEDGVFGLTADPTRTSVPPEPRDPVPHLNFAPLENALRRLGDASTAYDDALSAWNVQSSGGDVGGVNAVLIRLEQDLLLEQGLPRRPWFRHGIYAPGFYTGYGVKTIPGVREAVEERNWNEAEAQVIAVANSLDRVSASISRAADLIRTGAEGR
jgi:N-acetylated-alpha-linked acidic dipeptidase